MRKQRQCRRALLPTRKLAPPPPQAPRHRHSARHAPPPARTVPATISLPPQHNASRAALASSASARPALPSTRLRRRRRRPHVSVGRRRRSHRRASTVIAVGTFASASHSSTSRRRVDLARKQIAPGESLRRGDPSPSTARPPPAVKSRRLRPARARLPRKLRRR